MSNYYKLLTESFQDEVDLFTEGLISNIKAKKNKYDNMKKEYPDINKGVVRGKTLETRYNEKELEKEKENKERERRRKMDEEFERIAKREEEEERKNKEETYKSLYEQYSKLYISIKETIKIICTGNIKSILPSLKHIKCRKIQASIDGSEHLPLYEASCKLQQICKKYSLQYVKYCKKILEIIKDDNTIIYNMSHELKRIKNYMQSYIGLINSINKEACSENNFKKLMLNNIETIYTQIEIGDNSINKSLIKLHLLEPDES